jgi:hypothetical protein
MPANVGARESLPMTYSDRGRTRLTAEVGSSPKKVTLELKSK